MIGRPLLKLSVVLADNYNVLNGFDILNPAVVIAVAMHLLGFTNEIRSGYPL